MKKKLPRQPNAKGDHIGNEDDSTASLNGHIHKAHPEVLFFFTRALGLITDEYLLREIIALDPKPREHSPGGFLPKSAKSARRTETSCIAEMLGTTIR